MRLLILMLSLALVTMPLAAVTPNSGISPQAPRLGRIQILNGTGAYAIASGGATVTNTVAAFTCGANGSKILGMVAASNDTAARDLTLFMVPASNVPYILGTVTIPITAGQVVGTPAVNVLSTANIPGLPFESDGNPYILCESGDVLRVGVKVAVSANLLISVLTVGADY